MKPTKWFKTGTADGQQTAVARWYWPESTLTEVNTGTGWVERPIFLDLHDDPGWEETTEADVDAWLSSRA